MAKMSPTTVTTGQARLSYVHLLKPYARPGQEPKYTVTILLPKSDVATKQRIDAAIEAAAQEGVNKVWNGVRPPQLKTPIHDGDGLRPNGEPFGPECKGHWVFTASSKQPVEVVDINLNPILNHTEIYSGMYARVNVSFFPFSNSGNRGIGCGLGPVQKLADGEPLSGRVSAEQAFGSSPAPVQPQAPAQPGYAPAAQAGYGQPAQPGYGQPAAYGQPQQPGYAPAPQPYPQQPQAQPQQAPLDPITGQPLSGGIMGL
ncbi:hypothetical protein GCM10025857_40010 [Alicyclobacillus contaminans]|uniref:DUF2815 family protein n=1 Tax=Alicyclobacillus contaminans TaxID=392016 RepID=UPI0003F90533|nr:DUF2815 family protein [Alicyclobacillus contaminans]GMA52586.1 hypothetical protein GCM10025857_39430 [Alicyclobacillus contaminans]GMA52644.1 hypothetical protein GCM10025857_40010 [Alicyclobacillus contaminans]